MLPRRLPRALHSAIRSQSYTPQSRLAAIAPLRATQRSASTASSADSGEGEAADHKGTSGGPHGDHYDPPGGWLWGIRPGEKYEKEGWEGLYIYGYYGVFLIAAVAYAFKPDTTIQTWALEEARRRLEKEGLLEDPSPNWVQPQENRTAFDREWKAPE